MKSKGMQIWILATVLVAITATQAQETSRVIPFKNVATSLPPSTTQDVTVQLWDLAAGGTLLFSEAQPGLAVDSNGNISFVFGSLTPGPPPGLDPNNFPSGSSRFLDVVNTTGTSVLAARLPLNATPFALSPGPPGPRGDPGEPGPQGPPGPPGVVQSVTAGDTSIAIGGTPANPTVAVNTMATDTRYAQLGVANTFSGTQSISNGSLALPNTAGSGIGAITLGGALFLHNFGTGNTFLGQNAGNLTMTGSSNTASGAGALSGNTTGAQNSAFGQGALFSNTTGNTNAAFGQGALFANTTGFNNAAFGFNALNSGTTPSGNSAFGAFALSVNTTGESNSAFGTVALRQNTTGVNNSAFGNAALFSNTTGSSNAAFGQGALFSNTTAEGNSAFGFDALLANTTGRFNTASGYEALSANTTGEQNTAIGWRALKASTTGSHNTASGLQALWQNTTGESNTASGLQALYSNTTGFLNTAVGEGAGFYNTTGSNNTFLGSFAYAPPSAGNLTNATAIGAFARVSVSNALVLGGTGSDAVNVGIGTSAPTAPLDVAGSVKIEGTGNGITFPDGTLQTTAAGGGVTSVTAGDASIAIGGTPVHPTVAVATGGVDGSRIALPLALNGASASTLLTASNTVGAGISGSGSVGMTGLSSAAGATGVQGFVTGQNSAAVRGIASGDGGIGVLGTTAVNTAVAGQFTNTAGGKILSGQNNTGEVFSVRGDGAITSRRAIMGPSSCGPLFAEVALSGFFDTTCSSYALLGDGSGNTYLNSFQLGGSLHFRHNNSEQMTITTNGNVGIGTSSPPNLLTLRQLGGVALGDGWTTYSSRRWKTNIRSLDGALEKVARLRGVSYDRKADGKHEIGLVAEEVGEVVPEVVAYEDNGRDARGVDYARLTAVLIEAVKEQQAEISNLKAEVERLHRQFQEATQ